MGSTISSALCPVCGNEEVYDEYWYKSNEEMQYCEQCGYTHRTFIKRNENGFVKDKDGNPIWETSEEKEPVGAFRITYIDNMGQCGTIPKGVDIEQWKKELLEQIDENVFSVMISQFIDGEIKVTNVYQK